MGKIFSFRAHKITAFSGCVASDNEIHRLEILRRTEFDTLPRWTGGVPDLIHLIDYKSTDIAGRFGLDFIGGFFSDVFCFAFSPS